MRIAAFWETAHCCREAQTFSGGLLFPHTLKWRQQFLQKFLNLVTWSHKIRKFLRNRLTVPETKQMTD
jgi:hypothetical protein